MGFLRKKALVGVLALACASFLLPQSAAASAGAWASVGDPGFTAGTAYEERLAIDPSNVPYVAFYDSNNELSVMKFDGTSWQYVGASDFTTDGASSLSLAISTSSVPYVAYQAVNGDSKISVMRFNGTSWEFVGSEGVSTGSALYTSLVTYGNSVYVSYEDGDQSNKVTVMKYNGSTWSAVGSAGFSDGATDDSPQLAVSANGTPYIVYIDQAHGAALVVKKFNGTTWVDVGTQPVSAGGAVKPSIVIDPAGTPYITYRDVENGFVATVEKYDGVNWVSLDPSAFAGKNALDTTIVTDSLGTPYMSFHDNDDDDEAFAYRYDGTHWQSVGVPAFTPAGASYLSMVMSSDNTPYVAYQDHGLSSKATVMKFSSAPAIAWSGSFIESGNNDGSLTGSRIAALVNDTFSHAGSTLVYGTDYTITNKPGGLTPVMSISGDGATATLTFTGNATNNATANSMSDLGVTFLDGAFTSTTHASDVTRYTNAAGVITFFDNALFGIDGYNRSSDPQLRLIDPATGETLVTFGSVGQHITGLAFDPYGTTLYGVSQTGGADARSFFTISSTTGAASLLGSIVDGDGAAVTPVDIAFRSDGTLFLMSSVSKLYTLDIASCNGADDTSCLATLVGDTGLGTVVEGGISFDSNDKLYYVKDTNHTSYYHLDSGTGSILETLPFTYNAGGNIFAAATFDSTDTLYVSRINLTGGTINDLADVSIPSGVVHSFGLNVAMKNVSALAFRLPLRTRPAPPPISPTENSGSKRSTSIAEQIRNLVAMGKMVEAQAIAAKWSTLLASTTIPAAGVNHSASVAVFHRTLKLGMSGADVLALQRYLNTHGFVLASSGPGAPGQETDRFGRLTFNALVAFQNAHATAILAPQHLSSGTGIFGPGTIAFLQGSSAGSSPTR